MHGPGARQIMIELVEARARLQATKAALREEEARLRERLSAAEVAATTDPARADELLTATALCDDWRTEAARTLGRATDDVTRLEEEYVAALAGP